MTSFGYDGSKYCPFLSDDLSRYQQKCNLKDKRALGKVLQEFYQMIKMQTGYKVKLYPLDNDPAITNRYMREWAKTYGVHS